MTHGAVLVDGRKGRPAEASVLVRLVERQTLLCAEVRCFERDGARNKRGARRQAGKAWLLSTITLRSHYETLLC